MLSTKDVAVVYETLLSSPGMNDSVKIDLRISRKLAFLLTKAIDIGLSIKDDIAAPSLLTTSDKEAIDNLKILSSDILRKAGLTEMNDKINFLSAK